MAIRQPVRILSRDATEAIFKLEARTADTTTQLISMDGNSILSSVFVKAADAGTTVEVKYFQTTSGTLEEDSERQDLLAHRVLGAADAGDTDTILVTRIHNKPAVEVIVTGPGSITFGIYTSVRSETASDLDSALQLDDDVADLLVDKGIPMVCLDEATGKWKMVRCEDGALSVTGTLTSDEVKEREFGTATVAYGATATLITYTPTADIRLQRIKVGGDGTGDFTVKINTVIWAVLRNSWNDRQIQLPLGGKELSTSDTITIEVENTTPAQSGSCRYEAFIYRGDV
jgi:hypothetical protein